jgi:hypothetical protein
MTTTFQHKSLPITIDYTEWSKLSTLEQSNFAICNNSSPSITNISTTNVNSDTSDLLGLGKVAETVVLAPLAVGLGILNKIF